MNVWNSLKQNLNGYLVIQDVGDSDIWPAPCGLYDLVENLTPKIMYSKNHEMKRIT